MALSTLSLLVVFLQIDSLLKGSCSFYKRLQDLNEVVWRRLNLRLIYWCFFCSLYFICSVLKTFRCSYCHAEVYNEDMWVCHLLFL